MKPSVAELNAIRDTIIPRSRFKFYVVRVLRYSSLSCEDLKKIIDEVKSEGTEEAMNFIKRKSTKNKEVVCTTRTVEKQKNTIR